MRHYVPTFKMKPLTAAIIASHSHLGVTGAANAVHINPDGLGQILLFPYYTARGGHVDSVSKVDTGSTYKAVKVRFLEGKNSREVNDFNLFLSPQDVWTGAVTLDHPPAVQDVPRPLIISKEVTAVIDAWSLAVNASSRNSIPIVVLTSPREETKIPSNQELLDLIGDKPLEGYFPT